MILPRFYPILDTGTLAAKSCPPLTAAEALLEAGVRIMQFRHKGHYSRDVFHAASRIARLCRDAGVPFVVNDRADIALLVDGALHLGQDDLSPADARDIIGPHRILGFSTHNKEQLRAALAEPADYLALGPIFATGSKQNPDPVVGLVELKTIRPLSDRPLVAIGGITRRNASLVFAAGADSVAVIGDLLPDDVCTKASIRTLAAEWLKI